MKLFPQNFDVLTQCGEVINPKVALKGVGLMYLVSNVLMVIERLKSKVKKTLR